MSGGDEDGYAQNRARVAALEARCLRIRALNDAFRASFAGMVTVTPGIKSLGPLALLRIIEEVRNFSKFDTDNDPYGEHDFGAFKLSQETVFWKIDYYDKELQFGSPDPADPDVTARVLTIMLASEY